MAQYAEADADADVGGWEDELDEGTLFAHIGVGTNPINDSADDATYIKSSSAPSNVACGLDLSTVEDPAVTTGHIMRWRAMKDSAGGATIGLVVAINQTYTDETTPGTEIVSTTQADLSDTIATYTDTLTGGEAGAITDYSDLTVRFVANQT